jgi:hypothetical protein
LLAADARRALSESSKTRSAPVCPGALATVSGQ